MALDALLNSRSVEGPLAPLEKAPRSWEPRFAPSGRAARRKGGGLRLPLVAAGIVALLAGAGLAWRFLGAAPTRKAAARPSATPPSASPSLPPATPAVTPAPGGVATASTVPSPTSPAGATLPSPTPPAPAPATTPASTPAPRATPAPAVSAAPSLADARTLLRQGRLPEAAEGFVRHLRQAAPGGFSIQLLVACSPETVEKALASVSDPDLYILPVNYKGRPCYRVCWGVYEDEARAESATRAVPDYFRKAGAASRVVPASGLLP